MWQQGELEETTLSDSDCDEEEGDDDGEPIAKYTTEEQYQSYVPWPSLLFRHH
jgi:hypothetical protein